MACCCEHGNEHSGSIKCGEFGYLMTYQLLTKVSAPCIYYGVIWERVETREKSTIIEIIYLYTYETRNCYHDHTLAFQIQVSSSQKKNKIKCRKKLFYCTSHLITPCIANPCKSLSWSGVISLYRILPLLFDIPINLSPSFLLPQYTIVIFNPLLLYLPPLHIPWLFRILLSWRMRDIPIQMRRDLHMLKIYRHYSGRPIFLSLRPIFCHSYWCYSICIYHKQYSSIKATPHLKKTARTLGYKHDTTFPIVLCLFFFLSRLVLNL
jgi:hypothetical protein